MQHTPAHKGCHSNASPTAKTCENRLGQFQYANQWPTTQCRLTRKTRRVKKVHYCPLTCKGLKNFKDRFVPVPVRLGNGFLWWPEVLWKLKKNNTFSLILLVIRRMSDDEVSAPYCTWVLIFNFQTRPFRIISKLNQHFICSRLVKFSLKCFC